ncbi:MAG: hypothetical protein DME98_00805 [Verrucomicrobia bacterium]|nr:MAG: hypothetical protein DME98_00805 [Verrucomicrobiota bacterium]PYJ35923.1 MAG: hypothetical protein DME88_00350 [Verrucomicrobiota bacterium]
MMKIERRNAKSVSALTMIKITTTALLAVGMLMASSAFAGHKACCAKGVANAGVACVNLATLNLTPDQKAKIEAWQAECMKAGCTKESRTTFLNRAKEILSADQFTQLKAQCKRSAKATDNTEA